MSKIAISGASTGTATFTIESPATSTNRTLTLPDNTGTILTTGSTAGVSQAMVASGVAGTGPAFRAVRVTSQSSNHNTFTKVQLDIETFDTDNCFDNATNYRFTPNVAGYYQVNFYVNTQTLNATAQVVQSAIYKNGIRYTSSDSPIAQTSSATGWGSLTSGTSDIVYLNGSTDYIELFSYFFDYTSTTSKNISQAQFSAALVRAA
jgi:hypothetical protein